MNKRLAAKAGVDRHQQDHVNFVHDVIQVAQRRRRVEYQTGLATVLFNQLNGAIDVFRGFRMERDVVGARGGEIRDNAINRFHHQVHVNRRGDAIIAQRLANHRPDGQIGYVVVIHYVEVHHVAAGGQHVSGIFT
ncbi:hypothetical protein D3C79_875430 [compost metagenome]